MTQVTTISDFRNARCQKLSFNVEEYIAIITDQDFTYSLAEYTKGKIDGACITFFPDNKIFYGQVINNKQQGLCVFFLGNEAYLYTVFKGNQDPNRVIIDFAYMQMIIDIQYSANKKIQAPVQISYSNDEEKYNTIGRCLGINFPKHFRKWYLFVEERFDNHYKIPFLEKLQEGTKFVGYLREKQTLGIKVTKLNQMKQIGFFSQTRDMIGFGSKVIPTLAGDVIEAGNYQDDEQSTRQLIRYQLNADRPKQVTKIVRKYFFKSLNFKNQYLASQAIKNVWNYSFEVCQSLNDKQTQKYAQMLLEDPNQYQRLQSTQQKKINSKITMNPQKSIQKRNYQNQSKSLQKIRQQLIRTAQLRQKSQVEPKNLVAKAIAITPAELSKVSPHKSYIRSRSGSRSPTAHPKDKQTSFKISTNPKDRQTSFHYPRQPQKYNYNKNTSYDISQLRRDIQNKSSPIKNIQLNQPSYFPKNRERTPLDYSPALRNHKQINQGKKISPSYSPNTLRNIQDKRKVPGTSHLRQNRISPYKQSKTHNNKVDKTYIAQQVALNRANKQANEEKLNKIQKIYDEIQVLQNKPSRSRSKSPLSKNKSTFFTNYNTDTYRTQQPLQQFFLNQYSSTSPITKQINSKRDSSVSPHRKLDKSPSRNNIQNKPDGYLDKYEKRLKYETQKQRQSLDKKHVTFATDPKNVKAYYPQFQALNKKKQIEYEEINKFYDEVQKLGREKPDLQRGKIKKRQYSYLSGV